MAARVQTLFIKGEPDINENASGDLPEREDAYTGLRTYALVLSAWWREIVLGMLLAAAAGGASVLALGVVVPKYEAFAHVAIIPTGSNVAIDETFKAVSENFPRARRDLPSRRAALVGLVEHGGIAGTVAERLSGLLGDERYLVTRLLGSVSAKLVTIGTLTSSNQSDLIRITASADSPEKAAAVANAWAEEYVAVANALYETVPQSVISKIRTELELASEAYRKAQEELQAFLDSNNVQQLERQIEDNEKSIQGLRSVRRRILNTLFDEEVGVHLGSLSRNYDVRQRLDNLLGDALNLRAQIETAGGAGIHSTGLVVQLLKIKMLTESETKEEMENVLSYGHSSYSHSSYGRSPYSLEFVFDNAYPLYADAGMLRDDVDSVITALRGRIEGIDRLIIEQVEDAVGLLQMFEGPDEGGPGERRVVEGSKAPATPDSRMLHLKHLTLEAYRNIGEDSLLRSIGDLEKRARSLKTQVEMAQTVMENLEQDRDRKHSHLSALQNEMIELQLTSVAASSVVRLGSPAVAPFSAWPHPTRVAAVSGAVGLPVAMFFAFFMNSLGHRPWLGQRGTGRSEQARP